MERVYSVVIAADGVGGVAAAVVATVAADFFIFPPFVIKKLLYFSCVVVVVAAAAVVVVFVVLPEPLLLAFYYNKLSSVRVNGNSSYLYNVILKICINSLVDYSSVWFLIFSFLFVSLPCSLTPTLTHTSKVVHSLLHYADVPCMLARLPAHLL